MRERGAAFCKDVVKSLATLLEIGDDKWDHSNFILREG